MNASSSSSSARFFAWSRTGRPLARPSAPAPGSCAASRPALRASRVRGPNTYEVTGSDREVVSSREAAPTKSGTMSPFTAG